MCNLVMITFESLDIGS